MRAKGNQSRCSNQNVILQVLGSNPSRGSISETINKGLRNSPKLNSPAYRSRVIRPTLIGLWFFSDDRDFSIIFIALDAW